VSGHPQPTLGDAQRLLVIGATTEGSEGEATVVEVEAVPAEPFRPPRRTSKPRMTGVETATVVGPDGDEIHVDEHGRIRVRFPWDQGEERSSCWVRVSQGWAGTGYGMVGLPRIGDEVLVSFVGGNVDYPVVVGRLFNAVRAAPHLLPDRKTASYWRTSTTPGGGGFNEILLDDAAGHELVALRAHQDMRVLVKRDAATRIERKRTLHVVADEAQTIGGARKVAVTGADSTSVGGDRGRPAATRPRWCRVTRRCASAARGARWSAATTTSTSRAGTCRRSTAPCRSRSATRCT
jgi:type VI secretion system secreted protein VgrG